MILKVECIFGFDGNRQNGDDFVVKVLSEKNTLSLTQIFFSLCVILSCLHPNTYSVPSWRISDKLMFLVFLKYFFLLREESGCLAAESLPHRQRPVFAASAQFQRPGIPSSVDGAQQFGSGGTVEEFCSEV